MPRSRSVVDAVSRPRLFAVLDRQASVTVVQAPGGFGKRTLVASWLYSGGAAQRDVVWIDEETEAAPERWGEQAVANSPSGGRVCWWLLGWRLGVRRQCWRRWSACSTGTRRRLRW